jgi:putative aminopeptidase FrvX
MELLKQLCEIHSPSGEESNIKEFLLQYINNNQANWKNKPEIFHGNGFQDCVILVFGKPKAAIFAHMDSIGFTTKYKNELIKIGGPVCKEGIELVGCDKDGKIETTIKKDKDKIYAESRAIERGTSLTFKANYREDSDFVQCCYMDNRLGVYNALKVAETLDDGIICFSCWEEHKGGSVGYLSRFIYEKYNVSQALISDITWVTDGIKHNQGVAISIRDSGIPRRSYVNKIIDLAEKSKVKYQLEVESAGGSDGNEIQKSPYPIDWCFIGAPEDNVHSPDEKVHKNDIKSMINLYQYLMKNL